MSSHVNSKVNDEFLKWLNNKYGEFREVMATRGKKHECLGMNVEFTKDNEVEIDMVDYVMNILKEFWMDSNGIHDAGTGFHMRQKASHGIHIIEEHKNFEDRIDVESTWIPRGFNADFMKFLWTPRGFHMKVAVSC